VKMAVKNTRVRDPQRTQTSSITKLECLQLVRHVVEHENINPSEESALAHLEVELMADLIAEELTEKVDSLVSFDSPAAPEMLEAFAAWSKTCLPTSSKGRRLDHE
jgi:hypothetical protein